MSSCIRGLQPVTGGPWQVLPTLALKHFDHGHLPLGWCSETHHGQIISQYVQSCQPLMSLAHLLLPHLSSQLPSGCCLSPAHLLRSACQTLRGNSPPHTHHTHLPQWSHVAAAEQPHPHVVRCGPWLMAKCWGQWSQDQVTGGLLTPKAGGWIREDEERHMPMYWILALFQNSTCTPDLHRIAHFAPCAGTVWTLLTTLGSGRWKLSHLELLRNEGEPRDFKPQSWVWYSMYLSQAVFTIYSA